MASLQKKNESYHCQFYYLGKRHTIVLGAVSEDEAEAFAGSTELILLRLKQKLLTIPPGMGITDFILAGGKAPMSEKAAEIAREPITFRRLRERYVETHGNGAVEVNSLSTTTMHLNHFEATLGEKFPVQELSAADLQRHIDRRAKKKYRGKPLSPVTLRKEMASFRAAWNWGTHHLGLQGPFPSRGLVYPKYDEKPPFQTWANARRAQSEGANSP